MSPRKKRHNILYRTIFDSVFIEGVGFKAKFNVAKAFLLLASLTIVAVVLQYFGALMAIVKLIEAIRG